MTQDKGSETVATAAEPAGMSIALRKPILSYGDQVDRLVFREPTAADIMSYGDPVQFDFAHDPPRPVFDAKAMSAMIAALATVPLSSVAKMHPKDWKNCAWALSGFFTPDLGSSGTS